MIHYSKVVSVTPEGISVQRENGKIQQFAFKDCADRYKEHAIASGEFQIKDVESFRKQPSRCVGQRKIDAEPPCIEIFSEPRLKIIFTKPVWWSFKNPKNAFREMQSAIEKAGWTTADLS